MEAPIPTQIAPIPQFMIVPSTYSGMSSVISVVFLFVLYNIYIGYIACYNLKFYPNIYMVWNLLTSGNDKAYQAEFEDYVRKVVLNSSTEHFTVMQPSSLDLDDEVRTDTKMIKPLESPHTTSLIDSLQQKIIKWWNRLMLRSFVSGSTVRVSRR